MLERHHEQHVQCQVQRDRGEADAHRGRHVTMREEGRHQHFQHHEGGQPDRVGGQRLGAEGGAVGVEGAAAEQHQHDRPTRHCKGQRCRQGQHQADFKGPVHRRHRAGTVARAGLAGQQRQQRRADRGADHAQR